MGKGVIALYEQFLPFPQSFLNKGLFGKGLICRISLFESNRFFLILVKVFTVANEKLFVTFSDLGNLETNVLKNGL